MQNEAFNKSDQINDIFKKGQHAYHAALYVTAESLFAEAARLADEHAKLATRIKIKAWLAHTRGKLFHDEEALTTWAWLISVANDSQSRALLANHNEALTYLAAAFKGFVGCGRCLPAIPNAKLYEVIDMGLAFLSEVGRAQWGHGLRLERGKLLLDEGQQEEARQEMEAALALRRRHPNSLHTLGGYLSRLGDVLKQMEEYDAAEPYYREIWEGSRDDFYLSARQSAAKDLALLEKERGNLEAAEQWARKALALAEKMESAYAQAATRLALIHVLLKQEKVAELVREAATYWYWGRQLGTMEAKFLISRDLASIRLAMARAALGLPPDPAKPLPKALPLLTRLAIAQATRYLAAAERWLARMQEPARRLDIKAGVENKRNEVKEQSKRINALRALLLSSEQGLRE